MIQLWISLGFAAHSAIASQPLPVRFGREIAGRNVAVSIDGGQIKPTFAGKLAFQDPSSSWASVCADVRSPIRGGQTFVVEPMRSGLAGGNVAKAGHIVAKFFCRAQSADECAGLQLAVWEAIEDGGPVADFAGGHFRARATNAAIAYAAAYYADGIYEPDEAVYLKAGGGQGSGQNQLSPSPSV